jgi:hypothetical protein
VLSYAPRGRQQRRKPAPGTARAWILTAKLLDEFGVLVDDASATFDMRLARGNPRRRLLIRSKGRLSIVVAVHGDLLVAAMADTIGDGRLAHD